MTARCTWPDCTDDAHACRRSPEWRLMRLCLAQVPEDVPGRYRSTTDLWAHRREYDIHTAERDGRTSRQRQGIAREVHARLLAWLRWPGVDEVAKWQTKWQEIGLEFDREKTESALRASGFERMYTHPLDTDDVMRGLRAVVQCRRCRMTGEYKDREGNEHSCTEHVLGVDAILVLLDAAQSDGRGIDVWETVHAWRPSSRFVVKPFGAPFRVPLAALD